MRLTHHQLPTKDPHDFSAGSSHAGQWSDSKAAEVRANACPSQSIEVVGNLVVIEFVAQDLVDVYLEVNLCISRKPAIDI